MVRWQQIINPWIRFLCGQKKEDSGVNRQGRYLRIGHWHFRKKWKLFHKFAQGNMIWLRRKFIWKSHSFVLVTRWCTSGLKLLASVLPKAALLVRTWWRNIHRPTGEDARTRRPLPIKEEGCFTVNRRDISGKVAVKPQRQPDCGSRQIRHRRKRRKRRELHAGKGREDD